MAAEEPSDAQTQIQITLQYIDKLFESRRRLKENSQRFYLTGTVLAVILLATSGGAAYTKSAL